MNELLLSSLVTFKSLKDQGYDIYNVIGEFIKDIFYQTRIPMTSIEIKEKLYHFYGFSIPDAVIKTSLKRINANKNNGKYQLCEDLCTQENNLNLQIKTSDLQDAYNQIIDEIYDYIKLEYKENYISKEDILKSLLLHIKDDETIKDNSNIKYISSFIIKNQGNKKFIKLLNDAKDGYILLTGLSYQTDSNEIYNIKNDLTLLLDTELLFNSMGYNGELYKNIFVNDFFNLVESINNIQKNKKNNKSRIYLKYLTKTKEEINSFFYAAEKLLESNKRNYNNNPAMDEIISNCSNPSDVVLKKAAFFNNLKKLKIEELEISNVNITDQENYCFNIDSSNLRKQFLHDYQGIDAKTLDDHIETLNIINILRKGHNHDSLENIKYIFLTATSDLIKLSWYDKIKKNGDVPLVSDLGFMIDRFWFKLQKPLNDSSRPVSFQVATKAKIILSSLLKNRINYEFENIKDKIKSGELTELDAASAIAILRKDSKDANPDKIDSAKNVDDALFYLSNDDPIGKKLEEFKYTELKSVNLQKENNILKGEDKVNKEIISKLEKDKESYKQKLESYEKREKIKRQKIQSGIKFLKKLLITIFIIYVIYKLYVLKVFQEIIGYISAIITIITFLISVYKSSKNADSD